MDEEETILETVPGSDQIDNGLPLAELIAQLQSALDRVPEQFRHVAKFNVYAYDWVGVDVTYERPVTSDELDAKAALIESQRRKAPVSENPQVMNEWIRNVRLCHTEDRDEAIAFIQTSTESNQYHPDVYRRPMICAEPGPRPWQTAQQQQEFSDV